MTLWRFLRWTVWPFLREVLKRFKDDQGTVLSGYLAYSAMLSFFPFLIFASALAGFVIGPEESQEALKLLFEAVPSHVAQTLEPVILDVIGQRRGGVLTVSALGAIWAASNGIEALRIGLDHAYDVDDSRHVALSRLVAIAVVLSGFLTFVTLAVLIVLAPLGFHFIEIWLGIQIPFGAHLSRYAVGLAVLWAALWGVHRFLPSRRMGGFRIWPGILASMLIWVCLATAYSIYLAFAPNYSLTYGALAGVILTLLFFYLTGVALIFGAQVNATVNAHRLTAATRPDAPGGAES